MGNLPNMGNIVPGDIRIGGRNTDEYIIGKVSNNAIGSLGQRFIAVEEPNSGVSVQQIAAHLHIIPEIFERRVKIFRHAELPLGAAKSAFFYPFRLCRSKGKNNRPCRYFTGHVNNQTVADRHFYSLRNTHGLNIA